jgi:AraC-like DNA-binding protein
VAAGEAVFVKKGAYFIPAHSRGDPCIQLYFIPDDFVRETIRGLAVDISAAGGRSGESTKGVMRIVEEPALSAFFQAMAVYFAADEAPPEALLTLKLRELLTGILLSQKNSSLSAYLQAVAMSDAPSLPSIMEANWDHNLPLAAFARLCHRSLSSFKRDFHKHYRQTPARWLTERRLDRAFSLLRATSKSVTEIMLECGFEDLSHFSRAFKQKFGHSPSVRRQAPAATPS